MYQKFKVESYDWCAEIPQNAMLCRKLMKLPTKPQQSGEFQLFPLVSMLINSVDFSMSSLETVLRWQKHKNTQYCAEWGYPNFLKVNIIKFLQKTNLAFPFLRHENYRPSIRIIESSSPVPQICGILSYPRPFGNGADIWNYWSLPIADEWKPFLPKNCLFPGYESYQSIDGEVSEAHN